MKPTRAANHLGVTLAVTLAMAVPLTAWPATVAAGTYTFHSCRTPDGAPADVSGWSVLKGRIPSLLAAYNRCPAGPFELAMLPSKTHPSNHWLTARFLAPADTTISAYRLWRSVQIAQSYGWRYRERTASGTVDIDPCYTTRGCTKKGDLTDPFGAGNVVGAGGRTDITGLDLALSCAIDDSSSESCPATAPGARMQLHRADITLLDPYSPVIASPPTGSLVEPGRTLTGIQPVTISASDRGGGVYQVLLEVDGQTVESHTLDANGGACAPPFRSAVPCKLSASGTITLDTAAVGDGDHSLRLLVTDATGTNVGAWGPITIRTANALCNPRPVASSLELTASLRGRGKRSLRAITVRHGRKLRITGRLVAPGNRPVAGAALCVVARHAAAGAALRADGTVTTDADGRFSYLLRAGASRRVQFVYHVAEGAIVAGVTVRVRAPISLRGSRRALRNGETLRMHGRLRARPRRGVIVELQARRTSGWQTFGTTRTNRKGRFTYDYQFTRTQGVQQYRLRARVPEQAVYPFESGASRPLRVFVFG